MKCDELIPTEIYARFAEEVYDDFGDSPQEQEYYRKEHADAAIAELKQKLEDAGMRERKLKRALWLARAEQANDKARIFYFAETCGVKLNIDGYSNKEKGHTRMCTARWWRITWLKVERKCLKKAERYGESK